MPISKAIFFYKNISGIIGIESLQGFNVGVKKGDNSIYLFKKGGITNYVEFSNYESIVKAAKEHQIMAYIMDKPPALFYLYKMGIQNDFRSSSSLPYSGQLHRAVKKGDQKLLNLIQSGFDHIPKQEYRDIDSKWMGTSYDNRRTLFIFGIGILTASLIAMLHEWWNGAGYPLGLKGRDIPVQCRILSIVDAFDAMTSDRPYRKAMPVENALKELLDCSGTQFDPEYVENFIELIKDDLFKNGDVIEG